MLSSEIVVMDQQDQIVLANYPRYSTQITRLILDTDPHSTQYLNIWTKPVIRIIFKLTLNTSTSILLLELPSVGCVQIGSKYIEVSEDDIHVKCFLIDTLDQDIICRTTMITLITPDIESYHYHIFPLDEYLKMKIVYSYQLLLLKS